MRSLQFTVYSLQLARKRRSAYFVRAQNTKLETEKSGAAL
jgi:hypothetical protein